MELQNKKINFLGDSITEGHGTSGVSAAFPSLIKAKYNLHTARNYGIGGTRIAVQRVPSSEPVWDMDYCSRVDKMDPDADIVVIFGGTNDYGHGDAPLGTMQDRTPNSFYGACHTLYTSVINRFPDSVIVILTPLHRLNENSPTGDGYKAPIAPLSAYVNIIKEVAEYYSLPVLDLYACSGLQPSVPVIREKLVPDGLHPNDAGHVILAERIGNFLLSL